MEKGRNNSSQLFIEINSKNGELSVGKFKNSPFQQIYVEKEIQDYSKIRETISLFNNPLFYVHGYFSATKSIIKRTFIGFDNFLNDPTSSIDGVIHIIWDARTLNYYKSFKIIDKTKNHFAQLINILSKHYHSNLHLMCHSMGNKLFLESMNTGNIKVNTFTSLILSAPDIGVHEFRNHKEKFESIAKNVIILTHKKDKILAASKLLNWATRLGQMPQISVSNNIIVCDCTNVNNEQNLLSKLNKHFYFVASSEVRQKLHEFINDSNLLASKKPI